MGTERLRVGIVGLQPGRSWGAVAHVPALRSLAGDYIIAGVANSNLSSSQTAAAGFDIQHAFGSPFELIASPEIDLISVTVKVQDHLEIVAAAIAAGKRVYCEWPLGKTLEEAVKLAELAKSHHATCVIGLQALAAPEIV